MISKSGNPSAGQEMSKSLHAGKPTQITEVQEIDASQPSLKSGAPSSQISPDMSVKKSQSIKGQSDWMSVAQIAGKGGGVGRQSLSSSVSVDRASDQIVRSGMVKTVSADDSAAAQMMMQKSVSSDPFDVAPSAQKKNSQIEEVPELVIEE